jgi:hypothetical protein
MTGEDPLSDDIVLLGELMEELNGSVGDIETSFQSV